MTEPDSPKKSVGRPRRDVGSKDRLGIDGPEGQNEPEDLVSLSQRFSGWLRKDEQGQDFSLGLPVIIYARWVLVVAGFVLGIWNVPDRTEVVLTILVVLGLAVANFFLHVQILQNKNVDRRIAYGASVGDIVAITAVVGIAGTFPSALYVFYMPALLAIAVTFSSRITAAYGAAAIFSYAIIALTQEGSDEIGVLLTHLIILASVPICGNIYWRMERQRTELPESATDRVLTNESSMSSFDQEAPHE